MRGFQRDFAEPSTLNESIQGLADFISLVRISEKMKDNFSRGPVEGNSEKATVKGRLFSHKNTTFTARSFEDIAIILKLNIF